MGATVDEIATYRTRPVNDGARDLVADLENGRVDMVTFTSSSTVKHFHQMLPADRRPAFDGATVEAIRLRCGGHPYLIQLVCRRRFEIDGGSGGVGIQVVGRQRTSCLCLTRFARELCKSSD